MELEKDDKVVYGEGVVEHESAGGFVFYKDKKTSELFVALLKGENGDYVIPKGHIKESEKIEEGATREVMEELSLKEKPSIVSFIKVVSYEFDLGDNRRHYKNLYLYVFELNKKVELAPSKKEGFEAAEWFNFDGAVKKVSFYGDLLGEAKKFLV